MEGEFIHKTASNSGMNLLEGRGKKPENYSVRLLMTLGLTSTGWSNPVTP